MKIINVLFATCMMLFIISCKKNTVVNTNTEVNTNPLLIGKWNWVANYVSTGGPGTWIYFPGSIKNYVQFDADGNLTGNAFTKYSTYTIKDSVTLTLRPVIYSSLSPQSYTYKIVKDTLTMDQSPIVCIEGCGMKFFKEK